MSHLSSVRKTNPYTNYSTLIVGILFVCLFAAIGFHLLFNSHAATNTTSRAPTSPPVQVCGNASLLTGPTTAPSGAVTVPAGDNSNLFINSSPTANTTYYFAAGTHTLGTGIYHQIIPANNDIFIGAPGAILSGQSSNDYAFTQGANAVTIEYLTIEDFGAQGADNNEFVVNHDSGANWIIEHNTVKNNAGAGIGIGSGNTVEYNCLTQNQQYGYSSYSPSGITNVTFENNEVSYNNTYKWNQKTGCGCAGGGKFWNATGANYYEDNYVHDNYDGPGAWWDTDNAGWTITGNYISNNYAEGVMYEISYDANISDNTFINNAIGKGPTNPGFPSSAIYISESGSDPRINGPNNSSFTISNNVFTNNWGGVVLWENSNRFCGPGSPDNADPLCTLGDTSEANVNTCVAPGIDSAPLINDCRWRTQNVNVTNNAFTFNPSTVGSGCSANTGCGYNGIFSEYGTSAPFDKSNGNEWLVAKNIANNQNNHFANNTYTGPWLFQAPVQGTSISWAQWTNGYKDTGDGSNIQFAGQDQGSTYNVTGSQPPTVVINTPSNNDQVHGSALSVNATATANDNGSIVNAKLLVDNTVIQTINNAPYDFTLDTLNYAFGAHTIEVEATDDQGDVGSTSITVYVTNGDLNGDGVVNIADLAIMAANWNTGTTYAQGDINGQGPTNVQDLAILAGNWGDKAP